jgi:energy-coupling factor transporter transmembrane protein EcfT
MALFWLLILIPLAIRGKVVRAHFRFLFWIVLPVAAALFAVWGGLIGAAPGEPPGSAPVAGLRFAATTALRLTLLGTLWQLCFLTLSAKAFAETLRSWGLRGEALLVALGSLAVMPELIVRSQQVLTARYARGFLGRAGWWSRARQVPALLPPLVAWVLRSALQRGEHWSHRGLINRVEKVEQQRTVRWPRSSLWLVAVAFAWLAFGIITRLD